MEREGKKEEEISSGKTDGHKLLISRQFRFIFVFWLSEKRLTNGKWWSENIVIYVLYKALEKCHISVTWHLENISFMSESHVLACSCDFLCVFTSRLHYPMITLEDLRIYGFSALEWQCNYQYHCWLTLYPSYIWCPARLWALSIGWHYSKAERIFFSKSSPWKNIQHDIKSKEY